MSKKETILGLDQSNLITLLIVAATVIGGIYVMKNDIKHLQESNKQHKEDADRVNQIILDMINDLRNCK